VSSRTGNAPAWTLVEWNMGCLAWGCLRPTTMKGRARQYNFIRARSSWMCSASGRDAQVGRLLQRRRSRLFGQVDSRVIQVVLRVLQNEFPILVAQLTAHLAR
jgi:hypothetical protein